MRSIFFLFLNKNICFRYSLEATWLSVSYEYCKCPKISYWKASDKMTYPNNADPDQTAPEGAV